LCVGKGYCRKHYMQIYNHGKILSITIFTPNKIILYKDRAEIVLRNIKHKEVGKAIIDLEDVERVNKHKWYLSKGYAVSHINNKFIFLHNFILDRKENTNYKYCCDHINRNRLDDRKTNLRIVDYSLNNINKSISKSNKSGIVGVFFINQQIDGYHI